ncbi:LysE family translocator [Chlorobium sp. N1]|uniref:LysE family translocator n=1 Tax=Chlorobium sp. N1 TaxID=2491138 RepID=UPI00104027E6|nr:LysE family translocator [Chlorobium sp. N1]TCD47144.1 LysE family translocator [Chlorobium sp. N1]
MIDIQQLWVFCSASVLLSLSPGPDNLFVMAESARHGWRSGVLVTFGLCTGLLFHTLGVALGLAALVRGSLLLFTLLKWAGVLYLLFLAYSALRATGEDGSAHDAAAAAPPFRLYRRGIVMNLSNPKVSLFFLAFLPQFADPNKGPLVPQLLLLGFLFMAAALLVFILISLIAGHAGSGLRRSGPARRILPRLSALVFLGLAVRLFFAER